MLLRTSKRRSKDLSIDRSCLLRCRKSVSSMSLPRDLFTPPPIYRPKEEIAGPMKMWTHQTRLAPGIRTRGRSQPHRALASDDLRNWPRKARVILVSYLVTGVKISWRDTEIQSAIALWSGDTARRVRQASDSEWRRRRSGSKKGIWRSILKRGRGRKTTWKVNEFESVPRCSPSHEMNGGTGFESIGE